MLAAVSSHVALFPFCDPPQDKEYPPSAHSVFLDRKRSRTSVEVQKKLRLLPRRKKWLGKKDKTDGEADHLLEASKSKDGIDELQRRLSRRISRKVSFTAVNFHQKDEESVPGSPAIKNVNKLLPIPYDVLTSLATLCYPGEDYYI